MKTIMALALAMFLTVPVSARPAQTTVSKIPAKVAAQQQAAVNVPVLPATLDIARRRSVARLRQRIKNVEITFDRDGRTAILLRLPDENPYRGKAAKVAKAFIRDFAGLIDPSTRPEELRPSSDERSCGNNIVVYDRFVAGRRVLGSKVTFRFDHDGDLREVVNGIAPVPRTILPPVAGSTTASGLRIPVMVPEPGGLRTAGLLVQPDGREDFRVSLAGVAGTPGFGVATDARRRGGTPEVMVDPRTNLPAAISYYATGGLRVPMLAAERNPAEVVYRYLDEHPGVFHTGAPRCQFGIAKITRSPALPHVSFVRVQQQYLGIPVSGAELVFDVADDGRILAVSGHVLPSIHLKQTPGITEEQAIDAARNRLAETLKMKNPEMTDLYEEIFNAPASPELVVFPGTLVPNEKLPVRLAYEMQIGPAGVYVDAENGEVLFTYGTRAGQVVNDARTLAEVGRPAYVTVMVGGIPTGALPPPLNVDVAPAAASIATTRAFFTTLGWPGVNGLGAPYVLNTNVAMMFGCPNAFFDIFITGEAYACIGVASHPDVVAHELTHGIIANSTRLIYANESGALHEAYADLFGNLVFPDAAAPGTLPTWILGEALSPTVAAFGAAGLRNMNPPATLFGPGAGPDPGNLGAFLDRNAPGSGCTILPWSCDFGNVHRNNGIINRAHVILADGIPGVTLAGIGRPKLTALAFLVMTTRLTPFADLRDAAVATRDLATALVGTSFAGSGVFTLADVDQSVIAFRMVGLDPSMTSGWAEPAAGFAGTDLFFGAGETTPSGCAITNIRGILDTPIIGPTTMDLSPATPLPPALNLFVHGIAFVPAPVGPTPLPIGTTAKFHAVAWFDIYGQKPRYRTDPIDTGAASCTAPAGFVTIERTSTSLTRSAVFGGAMVDPLGNNPSTMAPACRVNQTLVELLNASGTVVSGPGTAVTDTVELFRIFGIPVTSTRTARIVLPLPTPRPPNLSATVASTFGIGTFATFRLRYIIDQPVTGPPCVP